MGELTITRGAFHYQIAQAAQDRAKAKTEKLPTLLKEIVRLSGSFAGKPQFVIEQAGPKVTVFREDYLGQLRELARDEQGNFGHRLSVSEWEVCSLYRGENPTGEAITLHDVFTRDGLTIKTGNPFCNNAYEEFHRALYARYAGLVEAKSPLGFVFHLDDIFSVGKPGLMFYKHIQGRDLEQALGSDSVGVLNWALWEAAKFFSRLINAGIYLEDADRINNYFIERTAESRVFRFLDLEKAYRLPEYPDRKKAELVVNFARRAIECGFLDKERLGEFVIVVLGAGSPAAEPVWQALKPTLG
jgi:hypothetical protein